MTPQEIRDQVRRQPFQPFRVHLANGSSYVVHHPETILITQTLVVIAEGAANGEIPAEKAFCDPYQITHLEPVQSARSQRRRRAKS